MTEEKRGPGRPPKAQTITCEVKRDYWPTPGDIKNGWPETERNRVRAGTLIDLDAESAIDGIEAGMLARVKA